jgi:MFS family permease
LLLVSLNIRSLPLFFIGTVCAGIGFGNGMSAFIQAISPLAETHERAELFAAIFVVSYLAFSVPAMIAGLLTHSLGLAATAEGYALLLIVMAALSMAIYWRMLRAGRG